MNCIICVLLQNCATYHNSDASLEWQASLFCALLKVESTVFVYLSDAFGGWCSRRRAEPSGVDAAARGVFLQSNRGRQTAAEWRCQRQSQNPRGRASLPFCRVADCEVYATRQGRREVRPLRRGCGRPGHGYQRTVRPTGVLAARLLRSICLW